MKERLPTLEEIREMEETLKKDKERLREIKKHIIEHINRQIKKAELGLIKLEILKSRLKKKLREIV